MSYDLYSQFLMRIKRTHSMFCIVCQKQFKTKNAYKYHASSASHIKEEEEYRKNIKLRIKKNTANFLADFHSYISQTTKYTEINQLYKQYLAKNRFRIEGTNLKSIDDAISELSERISVIKEDCKTMVKCLNRFEVVRKPAILNLNRLDLPFDVKITKEDRPRTSRDFKNIFKD